MKKEIEKLANEIAKDAYLHNSGSSLNPTVCRMMRIELETKIYDALLIIQNQAYEEAAEIVKSFTICEFDPRLASMQDQEMQLAYRIAQAIRAKIGEKKA